MKETSKQNLAILLITILVAATIFLFIRFIQPAITESKGLSVKIAEEKEKISLLQEYKAKSESLVQAYFDLGEQVNDIYLALPDDSQTAQLIATLDAISKRTEIPFSYLSFTESKQEGQDYLEIKTSFTTTYENFKNWLAEIERELRLIDLTRVNIEVGRDAKSSLNKFDVEMRAYFLNISEVK